MPLPATDLKLVLAARTGEDDAWDRLIAAWLPQVLRWCARLGGPRVDAEDAAHDVFIVAMEKIGGLRDPGRFASWMVGITRRVLAAHRRRAWLRRWVPGASTERADPRNPCWPELGEEARQVLLALETLKPDWREVVVLVDLEEHTAQEAAALLELPLGTVKSRLRRGRRALHRTLGQEPEPAEEPAAEGGLA